MDLFALIDMLLDDSKWPAYTNSKVLSDLKTWAGEAFKRDTFDGYLSYVLISHQVCEDYVLLLLRHAQFALRLHVLPTGFGWPLAKYEEPGVRESDMFGRLLQRLERSLEFEKKHEFIEACKNQNRIRNRLAHRLVEGIDLGEMRSLAQEYERGNRQVVDGFNDGDEHFSYFYCTLVLDPHWDAIIATQISEQVDTAEKRKWELLEHRLEQQRANSPLRRIAT